jgi:hypothetical protein
MTEVWFTELRKDCAALFTPSCACNPPGGEFHSVRAKQHAARGLQRGFFMTSSAHESHHTFLQMPMSEFWSGDLGLTLITISLMLQIFLVTPLREAALGGRFFFGFVTLVLMILGALVVEQKRIVTILIVAIVLFTAVFLIFARLHPAPLLHEIGSVLATITLLVYVRVVLLVMFRAGPVTWSRIQGGICAYLLVAMAWASGYQLLEQLAPGSFRFLSTPADMDQLTSKLTYYSLGALTSVGSDILPITPFARYLSMGEAVVGQLFPAILIGALVGLAMQSRKPILKITE